MEFKGLEKTSAIEWPGKMVSVVYTGGCNFRCPFCQNSDLVLQPENIPGLSEEEVINHLVSNKKWLDGLVVTGGEPTIHPSLPNFAQRVKEKDFEFGVETNGSNPDMLKKLIEGNLVDYIAFDVKAPLVWDKYKKAIGIDKKELLKNIRTSLEILKSSDIDHEYRTTIVPKLLEGKDIEYIAEILEENGKFYLQQYVPENTLDKEFENIEPYSEEKLKKIKKRLENRFGFEDCEIRNL